MVRLDEIREIGAERAERLKPQPTKVFPLITSFDSFVWAGSLSWAIPAQNKRLLKIDNIVNLFDFPQTPTEIGRDYLRVKYPERRRHFAGQYEEINKPRSAPLYAKPGNYRNMVYADLKSAYWSIISIWGWDCDYWPGKFLAKRSSNEDFPLQGNKLARNSLVTAGLVLPSVVWTGDKFIKMNRGNRLANYDIWALCQDTLAAIAHLAKKCGAVYVHTDGYIIPEFAFPLLRDEIAEWGLKLTIRHRGDARIRGVGAYQIGERKSGHFQLPIHAVFSVRKPDIVHLRNAFRRMAK